MKYYIGIDGGGTKTAVRLVDERKNILADFVRGRSNHGDVGMEASLSLIAGCVTDAGGHGRDIVRRCDCCSRGDCRCGFK